MCALLCCNVMFSTICTLPTSYVSVPKFAFLIYYDSIHVPNNKISIDKAEFIVSTK